ncbi:sensor histidine kinase [Aromatoleum toluvorans]|uniref:sensor histidine kinase n=1 Tax=Aromatoleum toluvorans TaxID=92002 RepID=UPI0031B5BB67
MVNEQHRLRRLVESLGLPAAPDSCEGADLDARLASLAGRLAREWMIEVSVRSTLARPLPEKLELELLHIVSEGVANAARHGGASHMRVEVRAEDEALRIIIADDGTGFPFRGYYDGCDLCREALGPRSLSARVGALGGRLGIHSTDEGARVEIRIPLVPLRTVADAEDHPRI